MIKRTIEISHAAFLRVHQRQLVIEQGGREVGRVPFEDVGVIVADHPAIATTQAVLQKCAEHNAVFVTCDRRHIPALIALPVTGHTLQARILHQQAAAKPALQRRLWQQVVRAKIARQAALLAARGSPAAARLGRLMKAVRSGDPENAEAQASREYWHSLFDASFRRDPNLEGVNQLLNYGYAVIRAVVARAIVSAGLHPSFGIHHRNQYDDYALADDLMEPLRPLVDRAVLALSEDGITQIDPDSKQALLALIAVDVRYAEQRMPLMSAVQHSVDHYREVLAGARRETWRFAEDAGV